MKFAPWWSRPARPFVAFVSVASIACAAGLSGSPALAAHSHDPLTVDQVLENVRRATGYHTLTQRGEGIQLTGKGSMVGSDSTFTLIVDGQGRFMQSINGPISVTNAYDGKTAWVRDIGGEVRIQELSERAQAILTAGIVSGSWLSPAAPFTYTLDEAATTDDTVRLNFNHEGALETGSIDIDRASWMPTQWTYVVGPVTSTFKLEGTLEHAGVKLPATIHSSTSSGSVTITSADTISDPPNFIRSPFEVPSLNPGDTRFDPAAPTAVEIKKAPTGHLLVHPLVNGKDMGWFIFDTGAGANVLDNRAFEELNLDSIGEIPAVGVGGAVASKLARPQTLTLGGMTIDQPLVVVMDLAFLDQYMGVKIGGLVGYGLLARAVVELDMQTPALALHDPAAFDGSKLAWSKLHIDQRIPCVEASFEGHDGIFKLDSGAGADSVTFHAPTVEKLKLLEGRETTPTKMGGVGGFVTGRAGNLAWFEIGGQRHENVSVTFATEAKGAFANPYITGNLGGGFIKPFNLILDYQHGRIAYVVR